MSTPRVAEREEQIGGLVADSTLEQLNEFHSRPFELGNTSGDDYPSLGSASTSGAAGTLGWQGSHGRGRVVAIYPNRRFRHWRGLGWPRFRETAQGEVPRDQRIWG